MALSYASAAAEVMEHLCEHDGNGGHGYSQPNRAGVGTGGTPYESVSLSDGTAVKIAYGDRDCSSAAIECYAALGVKCGGASYTGNMRKLMTKTGNFEWISDLSKRRRGDILLNETHHAAVFLGSGTLGQFSISENGTISGQRGDQTGYESNIKSYYNYPWDGILRYCGPSRSGSTSESVKIPAVQSSSGKIEVDGYWGEKTTGLIQTQGGTTVDCEVWGQDEGWKEHFAGCTTGWCWCTGDDVTGSPCIKRMQTTLRDKYGQDVGDIDGIAGRKFWQALERAAGYDADEVGLEAPSNTIKWLQTMLNSGEFF